MVDKETVATAELAIQEVGIIVDVVIRREQRRIDVVVRHPLSDVVLTSFHFRVRERGIVLFAVVPFHHMEHVISHLVGLSLARGR